MYVSSINLAVVTTKHRKVFSDIVTMLQPVVMYVHISTQTD